jgi:GTP-binding protein HflX
MFERPRGGDRALLVALDFGDADPAERMAELDALAVSAGATVVGKVTGRRQRPDSGHLRGQGKVDEVATRRVEAGADLVIFNHALSGVQQRNLEQKLECRVVDRTSLILDIFALRARSAEGKLQVELAQVKHQLTRLVGGWTHLERQKGGIGLRGPGEKQLETDRRLLGERVRVLKDRLSHVERQRAHAGPHPPPARGAHRGARRLHQRRQVDALQPADRRQHLRGRSAVRDARHDAAPHPRPGASSIVLSDTVGFIRDLPHDLVAAFRATLAAAAEADLLLHVIDAAHPSRDEQIAAVDEVLKEIGADHVPEIRVWNKIDEADLAPGIERDSLVQSPAFV